MIGSSVTEWFIADTHFGDKSVIERRGFGSATAMAETIAAGWRELVAPTDFVWVLGDAGRDLEVFRDLPGRKGLVGGNCDGSLTKLPAGLFESAHGVKYLPGLMLTHVPIHPCELYGRANVHGHMHAKSVADDRFLCVSAEQTGYVPISRAKVDWSLARHHLKRYPIPAGKKKAVAA